MKHLRLFSVIMVLALCFGAAQSVDAKKKKTRKRVAKTEKKQTVKQEEVDDRAVGVVYADYEDDDVLTPKSDGEEVFKSSAYMPKFLGGDYAMMRFINNNIRYPQTAAVNHIEGKVIVQFVVEKDGSIGEVKVVRGVHKDLDQEAVRVIKMLPKFSEPGRNAIGEPVRVWYTLPINFKLQGVVEDGPTGDYAYDAKQVGEKLISFFCREIKSENDLKKIEEEMDAFQNLYDDYYKAKGEDAMMKFEKELDNLMKDSDFAKRLEEAQKLFDENCSKLIK